MKRRDRLSDCTPAEKTVKENTPCRTITTAFSRRRGLNKRPAQLTPHLRHHLGERTKTSDGTIKALSLRQVADLLGHSASQITELYYVKKDTARLTGITVGFEM